ncbi:MAG: hypothetical protein R3A10_13875 [Caldilineaceae bacterium]
MAENYSTSLVHATGSEFMQMLQVAGLTGNERVLDAGCGAGHTALAFAPHVREVVALISEVAAGAGAAAGHSPRSPTSRCAGAMWRRCPLATGSST